eukprot:58051-Rhodomonas_salina.1
MRVERPRKDAFGVLAAWRWRGWGVLGGQLMRSVEDKCRGWMMIASLGGWMRLECWRMDAFEGHAWTEKFGTYENGTTWKEKSLTKDQFWVETNGWDSEGRIWGVRQGLTGDGKGWT